MCILFYNGFINWILSGNIGKSRFYDMMNLDFESIVLEQKRMFSVRFQCWNKTCSSFK